MTTGLPAGSYSIDREIGTFTITLGIWSNTYGIGTAERWLDFYRRQKESFPKSGTSYDRPIRLLEQIVRDIQS